MDRSDAQSASAATAIFKGKLTMGIGLEEPVVRLLPIREVIALTSLSRTTLWRRAREGSFPQPVQLGEQRIAWRECDVARWIATRTIRPSAAGAKHV